MHLWMERLRKTIAAGNKKRRPSALRGKRTARTRKGVTSLVPRGVKLCRVGKDDGQHSDAFQQVEHAKAAYSAGLGAFHEKGPPCAPFVPEAPEGRVLGAINKNMKLGGELFCQMI